MSVTMGMVTGYGRMNVRETALHVVICPAEGMELTDGLIRARDESSLETRTIRELGR